MHIALWKMLTALASVLAAALAVVITLRWRVVAQRKDDHKRLPGAHLEELLSSLGLRMNDYETRMGALEVDHVAVRAAVAHGIEDIERVDNRIKATIRRTTKQLEEAGVESPGLNAEAEHFRVIDGDGGEAAELPPVRDGLDEDASSIPGVPASALAKVRGYYGSA